MSLLTQRGAVSGRALKAILLASTLALASACSVSEPGPDLGCTTGDCADAGPGDGGAPLGSRGAPADAADRARLEELCGCAEAPADMPFPSGSPSLWCYDGCNWCGCTEDGRGTCTARACVDAGAG